MGKSLLESNEHMLIPVTLDAPHTASDDPRLGHLILNTSNHQPRVVLIGFPSDEGVRINGGRRGAADAPDLIRQALYRLTPDPTCFDKFCRLLETTQDLGNVDISGNLEKDQENLGKITGEWLAGGVIPIILGGGHETAFGHFSGYVRNQTKVNILNIDAHADVRPLKDGRAHSGSPFFQAIEHPDGCCKQYSVFGLMPWSVSQAHIAYMNAHGCSYKWIDEVTPGLIQQYFCQIQTPTMVTLDIDVVAQHSAPGVSAPAAAGLPPTTFYQAAYEAGKSPHVTSLDLVEVNPRFDIDQRTIRTAAVTIWHFLKGIAEQIC